MIALCQAMPDKNDGGGHGGAGADGGGGVDGAGGGDGGGDEPPKPPKHDSWDDDDDDDDDEDDDDEAAPAETAVAGSKFAWRALLQKAPSPAPPSNACMQCNFVKFCWQMSRRQRWLPRRAVPTSATS